MPAAECWRCGQRQKERRAKPARRSSRLIYPKTAARGLHQSRSAHKNQNPQNGHHRARFDWGLGAVCFGASPVAAVFGSAPGSATPPEHRIHSKPNPRTGPSKQDISTLLGIGHFYFALTVDVSQQAPARRRSVRGWSTPSVSGIQPRRVDLSLVPSASDRNLRPLPPPSLAEVASSCQSPEPTRPPSVPAHTPDRRSGR